MSCIYGKWTAFIRGFSSVVPLQSALRLQVTLTLSQTHSCSTFLVLCFSVLPFMFHTQTHTPVNTSGVMWSSASFPKTLWLWRPCIKAALPPKICLLPLNWRCPCEKLKSVKGSCLFSKLDCVNLLIVRHLHNCVNAAAVWQLRLSFPFCVISRLVPRLEL